MFLRTLSEYFDYSVERMKIIHKKKEKNICTESILPKTRSHEIHLLRHYTPGIKEQETNN